MPSLCRRGPRRTTMPPLPSPPKKPKRVMPKAIDLSRRFRLASSWRLPILTVARSGGVGRIRGRGRRRHRRETSFRPSRDTLRILEPSLKETPVCIRPCLLKNDKNVERSEHAIFATNRTPEAKIGRELSVRYDQSFDARRAYVVIVMARNAVVRNDSHQIPLQILKTNGADILFPLPSQVTTWSCLGSWAAWRSRGVS